MPLKNRYSILDENDGTPEPFRIPPIFCGDYVTTGIFGENYNFYVRYMPRRARYTGRFGLFLDDPDAGNILVATMVGEEFEPVSPTFQFCLQNFIAPKEKVLLVKRCCWCGRELGIEGTEDNKIHLKCSAKAGVL